VVSATPLLLYPRERDLVPVERVPEPVWTGAEILAATVIRMGVHTAMLTIHMCDFKGSVNSALKMNTYGLN